jgi:osmotically-inducible protein OsmY
MKGTSASSRRRCLRLAGASAGLLLLGSLPACVPLAATGIAVGGLAMLDRRTVGAQTDDQAIEIRAASALRKVAGAAGVSVTSFNRKVLLTGVVTDDKARQEIETAMGTVTNVRSVHNETTVGFRPSLSTSAGDTALTARVKAAFVEARDLQTNAFKVVTESSTVYLMGLVTRREGERAAYVASTVGGVRRVVTVFEYISEEELTTMERNAESRGAAK